jgi:hypothetical protein
MAPVQCKTIAQGKTLPSLSNQSENHINMNSKLTDKGWQDMIQHLDREMPVNKRRKYPIIWFSTGVIALGVIVVWSLFFHSNDKNSPFLNLKPEEHTPAVQTADRKIETENSMDLNTQNNKVNYNSGKELTVNSDNTQGTHFNPVHSIGNKSTVENLKVHQSAKSLSKHESIIADHTGPEVYRKGEISNLFSISASSATDHTSSENIAERQIHEKISQLPEILSEHLMSYYPYRSEQIHITLLPLKYKRQAFAENTLFNRWSAYALAGAGSSKASLFGAGLNYNLIRHEDRALTISFGANLYRNNSQTAISLADAENSGIEPDQIFTTGWEPTTGTSQPVTLSLQNMAEFEAGIFYHQKIFGRWFASGGVSGLYRRHLNGYGAQDRSLNNHSNSLDSSSPVYNQLYNQYDLRPALGIGLLIHKRWSVSTRYTYGLLPVNKFAENASDKVFSRLWLLNMTFDL